jgi:hypothetical protein
MAHNFTPGQVAQRDTYTRSWPKHSRCTSTTPTHLGSTSTPDTPALIVYAPLSRISTGVDMSA